MISFDMKSLESITTPEKTYWIRLLQASFFIAQQTAKQSGSILPFGLRLSKELDIIWVGSPTTHPPHAIGIMEWVISELKIARENSLVCLRYSMGSIQQLPVFVIDLDCPQKRAYRLFVPTHYPEQGWLEESTPRIW